MMNVMSMNLLALVLALLLCHSGGGVAAFAAKKKPAFVPYGMDHQDNGKGGKGPLGKQWTSKQDTLAEKGVGPAGAQLTKPSSGGAGSNIKRSVDIMADNRQKVSVLKDLLK
jgi:hypothetical protein